MWSLMNRPMERLGAEQTFCCELIKDVSDNEINEIKSILRNKAATTENPKMPDLQKCTSRTLDHTGGSCVLSKVDKTFKNKGTETNASRGFVLDMLHDRAQKWCTQRRDQRVAGALSVAVASFRQSQDSASALELLKKTVGREKDRAMKFSLVFAAALAWQELVKNWLQSTWTWNKIRTAKGSANRYITWKEIKSNIDARAATLCDDARLKDIIDPTICNNKGAQKSATTVQARPDNDVKGKALATGEKATDIAARLAAAL